MTNARDIFLVWRKLLWHKKVIEFFLWCTRTFRSRVVLTLVIDMYVPSRSQNKNLFPGKKIAIPLSIERGTGFYHGREEIITTQESGGCHYFVTLRHISLTCCLQPHHPCSWSVMLPKEKHLTPCQKNSKASCSWQMCGIYSCSKVKLSQDKKVVGVLYNAYTHSTDMFLSPSSLMCMACHIPEKNSPCRLKKDQSIYL